MLDQELKKIVKLTAHTQRNWDVSVPFPQPHTQKIVDFAVNCPTKNGINYYDLAVVTDPSVKRELYDATEGYTTKNSNQQKNSQVLAPLVLVWLSRYTSYDGFTDAYYEDEMTVKEKLAGHNATMDDIEKSAKNDLDQLANLHVGVSSAYANLMAGNLGYKTGFCKCFIDKEKISHALGVNQKIILMLGVGEANETLKYNQHHETSFEYGTTLKYPVKIINL